jgi:serine/threonine-protein kinase RsbW
MIDHGSSMPMEKNVLTLKIDFADIEQLHSFLVEIQQRLSISDKCLFETNLALEEVFSNVLEYGFTTPSGHFVQIAVTVARNVLNIRVEDDGKPFNPLKAKEPDLEYDLENCAPGGLGIHLIKHFMDDIRYERYQNRNVLTMRKKGCFQGVN